VISAFRVESDFPWNPMVVSIRLCYQTCMNGNPSAPPLPPSKKGMPVLGWVGIGCGTMLLIAVVIISLLIGWCKRTVGDISEFKRNPERAAAEMMVRMNPDLKKISQDDAKGEMTIRTKDGQQVTLSYKEISQGKFTIKDAEANITQIGQVDLTNVPAWVPRLAQPKVISASIQNTESGKVSGLYSATSGESINALDEFFKAETGKLKFTKSSSSSFNADGVENRNLSFEGAGRKLNVVLTGKPGEDVQVNVGYEETK